MEEPAEIEVVMEIGSQPILYFGIEIEFRAPRSPDEIEGVHSPEIAQDLTLYQLAMVVQAAGLPAACRAESFEYPTPDDLINPLLNANGTTTRRGQALVIDRDSLNNRRASREFPYRHWFFKYEPNVSDEVYPEWIPVEVNSPIMTDEEVRSGLPTVGRALRAIRNAIAPGVHIGERYGLHVHVSPKDGLTLGHAKQITTLVWLLEESLLYPLCAPGRKEVNVPLRVNYLFNCHCSDGLDPSTEMRDHLPPSLLTHRPHTLKHLWETRTLGELGMAINRKDDESNSQTFGLMIVDDTNDTGVSRPAMEFRYSQATFRIPHIHAWVAVILQICRVAMLPAGLFRSALDDVQLIILGAHPPEETWKRLLQSIELYSGDNMGLDSAHLFWHSILSRYEMGATRDVDANGIVVMY
ncbi:hypothetical protein B0I35DRAFT_172548 [Stachybotrys elegans]|uniref:Amidoligase enzyme-domain-containing protein n=1 Tax=Stachybotrys elegans TaxID=80388 RepID=A0A8K0WVD6_9HYPO|nr:hypothetical protein B0I35DRAFT_172548 [Stachybotrys elegans]